MSSMTCDATHWHIRCEYKSISLYYWKNNKEQNQTGEKWRRQNGWHWIWFHWVTHWTKARPICFWMHAFVFAHTVWWVRAWSSRYDLFNSGGQLISARKTTTTKQSMKPEKAIASVFNQSTMTMKPEKNCIKWKIRNQIDVQSGLRASEQRVM